MTAKRSATPSAGWPGLERSETPVRLTRTSTTPTTTGASLRSRPGHPVRRGFSLFEVVVASLLVGTLLVASARSVSSSLLSQTKMANRAKAAWLADGLIAEIHQQNYLEPGATSSALTRETGESSTSRAAYDDVDDYRGYSESPPKNKDGTTLPDLTGWSRSVAVDWVHASTLATVNSETGVKKATVTVSYNGQALLTRVILRTRGT